MKIEFIIVIIVSETSLLTITKDYYQWHAYTDKVEIVIY